MPKREAAQGGGVQSLSKSSRKNLGTTASARDPSSAPPMSEGHTETKQAMATFKLEEVSRLESPSPSMPAPGPAPWLTPTSAGRPGINRELAMREQEEECGAFGVVLHEVTNVPLRGNIVVGRGIEDDLNYLSQAKNRVETLCSGKPVHVLLHGQPGLGKSFFSNAICGVEGLTKSGRVEGNVRGLTKTPRMIQYDNTRKLRVYRSTRTIEAREVAITEEDQHGRSALEQQLERWEKQTDLEPEPILLWESDSALEADALRELHDAINREDDNEQNLMFEILWNAPGLLERNVSVIDLPGWNDAGEKDGESEDASRMRTLRHVQTVFAMSHANVVLSLDVTQRGAVGRGCVEHLDDCGWLHNRDVLPALGFVVNKHVVKSCESSPAETVETAVEAIELVYGRRPSDLPTRSIPHADLRNNDWLLAGIQAVHVPSLTNDGRRDSVIEGPLSGFFSKLEVLCEDFKRRLLLSDTIKFVHAVYGRLRGLKIKVSGRVGKHLTTATQEHQRRLMNELITAQDIPRGGQFTFKGHREARFREIWEAFQRARDEELDELDSGLRRCRPNSRETVEAAKAALENILIAISVLRSSLIESICDRHVWRDLPRVQRRLAELENAWREEKMAAIDDRGAGSLEAFRDLLRDNPFAEAARLQEAPVNIKEYVKRLKMTLQAHVKSIERALKKVEDPDTTWREIHRPPNPTRLLEPPAGQGGLMLRSPVTDFSNITEAKDARCISANDSFVKHQPSLQKQARSQIRVTERADENWMETADYELPAGILAPRSLSLTLDTTQGSVVVQAHAKVLAACKEQSRAVAYDAAKFMENERDTTVGPSLFPVCIFTDVRARKKDTDFYPRFHLANIIKFVRLLAQGDARKGVARPDGKFLILIVRESLDSAGDGGSSSSPSSADSTADGATSDFEDTASDFRDRMKIAFEQELALLARDPLIVQAAAEVGEPVDSYVAEIFKDSIECVFDVQIQRPNLGIGRMRSIAQLLCERWLATPYYFQLDDDLDFEEYIMERQSYIKGSCSCPRALAYMQKCMYDRNQDHDVETATGSLRALKWIMDELKANSSRPTRTQVQKIIQTYLELAQISSSGTTTGTAHHPNPLASALSKLDGTDFGKDVGKRVRKLLDELGDDDDPSKLEPDNDIYHANELKNRLVDLGRWPQSVEAEALWDKSVQSWSAFLEKILMDPRCAHASISNLLALGDHRKHFWKSDPKPTHRYGLQRYQAMLFNSAALQCTLYVGDDYFFKEPWDRVETNTLVGKAKRASTKKNRRFKFSDEGLRLARHGYKFSDSFWTRQLLLHGRGGIDVFLYATTACTSSSAVDRDGSTVATPAPSRGVSYQAGVPATQDLMDEE